MTPQVTVGWKWTKPAVLCCAAREKKGRGSIQGVVAWKGEGMTVHRLLLVQQPPPQYITAQATVWGEEMVRDTLCCGKWGRKAA